MRGALQNKVTYLGFNWTSLLANNLHEEHPPCNPQSFVSDEELLLYLEFFQWDMKIFMSNYLILYIYIYLKV